MFVILSMSSKVTNMSTTIAIPSGPAAMITLNLFMKIEKIPFLQQKVNQTLTNRTIVYFLFIIIKDTTCCLIILTDHQRILNRQLGIVKPTPVRSCRQIVTA